MTLVNANYFKCVFASFSSLVKGSVEFPCNKLRKRHIHVEWLLFQLFSTVFFSVLASFFKWRYMYLVVSLNASWYVFSQLLISRNGNISLHTFVYRHVASSWIFHLWSSRKTRRATYETSNNERWIKICC